MSAEMLKATKVRIYPTPEQAEFLNRQFGAMRFVYNKALHIISSQYKRHGLKLKAKKDLKPLLAVAKNLASIIGSRILIRLHSSKRAPTLIKPSRTFLTRSFPPVTRGSSANTVNNPATTARV